MLPTGAQQAKTNKERSSVDESSLTKNEERRERDELDESES